MTSPVRPSSGDLVKRLEDAARYIRGEHCTDAESAYALTCPTKDTAAFFVEAAASIAALSEENARLRGVTQEERREGRCDDCGGVNPVWYAPNALWNAVVGGAEADEAAGFICPVCFIKRAEKRGEMHVWKMAPETDEDQARSAKMFALSEENERLKAALEPQVYDITDLGRSVAAHLREDKT